MRYNRSRDPYRLTARYSGPCARKDCARGVKAGDSIFYYPSTRSAYCAEHADDCEREFLAAKFDEDMAM